MARKNEPEMTIGDMVDEAAKLDVELKTMGKRLDYLKEKIKLKASKDKKTLIEGATGIAIISPTTTSSVDAGAVMNTAPTTEAFLSVVKVSMTEYRKTDWFDSDLLVETTNNYGKISFKQRS